MHALINSIAYLFQLLNFTSLDKLVNLFSNFLSNSLLQCNFKLYEKFSLKFSLKLLIHKKHIIHR